MRNATMNASAASPAPRYLASRRDWSIPVILDSTVMNPTTPAERSMEGRPDGAWGVGCSWDMDTGGKGLGEGPLPA